MYKKIMINWMKRNKLASVLLLVVAYLVVKSFLGSKVTPLYNSSSGFGGGTAEMSLKTAPSSLSRSAMPVAQDYTPVQTADRMVVRESDMSLVVKDVRGSVNRAIKYSESIGGYMVSSSLSQPQEAPFANLVLRVPSKELNTALDFFRSLSIKVSSENLFGTDVTDQYTDIDARLTTLNQTKTKFEEIMKQATKVQDILEVQREIINIQNQIDNLKGQQLYLEKTSELAKITLYLSSDEYSLPYAPAGSFRPEVIFKMAIRSLVGTLRGLAQLLIWIGVYSVIWLPILGVIIFFRRRIRKP